MKVVALDTNILLGFKKKREPGFKEIKNLFEDCLNGKLEIFIPQVVFPEIEWVLRSYYKEPKQSIVGFYEELLKMEGVVLENKPEMQQALNIFSKSNIKLTDAIILAQIQRIQPDEFWTFDENLQKLYKRSLKTSFER